MTAVIERPEAKTILLSVSDETIDQMSEKYLALRVAGIDDKEGLITVKAALKDVSKVRIAIEKTRKALKEESLQIGKAIDAEAKRLTGKTELIESYLQQQADAVEKEIARIAQQKKDEQYELRKAKLATIGVTLPEWIIRDQTDDEFTEEFNRQSEIAAEAKRKAEEKAAAEAERQRILAEQEEANRIEREKLAAERAELDRQRQEQQAESARLAKIEAERVAAEQAESRRKADDEAVKQRQAEMKRLEAEAAERARIETEARIKREAEEKKLREEQEAAELAREQELKPAREKLELFAVQILAQVAPVIDPATDKAVADAIDAAVKKIRTLAKGLK